jgi:O-antigen/teichoic acid export membrane protein
MVPLVELGALVCVSILYLSAFSRCFGSLRQKIDWCFLLRMWRRAFPIGASEFVWALKVYFATALLGILVDGPEVGWFGAAHRIVVSLHTFVWLYFFNLLPAIARSTRGSSDEINHLTQTSMRLTALGGVFLGVVGTAFARPIITLIYGTQYHEAVAVFRVLVWLLPLALMSGHFRYMLIGYNRQDLEFVSAACGGALNVALNLFLTASYGIQAAAWALIASEILIWVLAYYFVRLTIANIPVWPSVGPSCVNVGERKILTQFRSIFVRQR